MTLDDVHEMCDYYGVERDDTLFVLFKRGEYNPDLSRKKIAANEGPDIISVIHDETQFSETQRNA